MNLLSTGDLSAPANCAQEQIKTFNQLLKLRISLQRSLEICNSLPVETIASSSEERERSSELLKSTLGILFDSLSVQETTVDRPKRQKTDFSNATLDEIWGKLYSAQAKDSALGSKWRTVTDSWSSRMHFGGQGSSLKVLNYSMWNQIEEALENNDTVQQKSRMLFSESPRIQKEGVSAPSSSHGSKEVFPPIYDDEVYDDRAFYSMLLKLYMSQDVDSNTNGDFYLNADDTKELRRVRGSGSKNLADRKASKGRKIRYVPHVKLQNFMFPVANSAESAGGHRQHSANGELVIDSERLFSSLFQ
jgi:protein AATF/BFR2